MRIEIVKIAQTDAMLAKVMRHCWKVNSKMDMSRLYASNDSILEIPEYYAFCTAPRSVAMQLETHKKKNGCYVWLQSGRPDLKTAVHGEYSREQEINFVLKFTARGIKEISHQRLCNKAEAPTREFMYFLRNVLFDIDRELAENMMPLCEFRGGICTEFNCCGRNKTYKNNLI